MKNRLTSSRVKSIPISCLVAQLFVALSHAAQPGLSGRYAHQATNNLGAAVVKAFSLTWGPLETANSPGLQWLELAATKVNGDQFRIWLLSDGNPPENLPGAKKRVARFILQERDLVPREFWNRFTGEAVLPSSGAWPYLIPRPFGDDAFPKETHYLGHVYQLEGVENRSSVLPPASPRKIELSPDMLIGLASNTRQKDDTRRWDGSDYELVRLTREDLQEMAQAGINCFHIDAKQLPLIDDLDVFYWGVGGQDIRYPECLYDSRYLGPALFLDEPAVGTRDAVIRPRLGKDNAFRKALTPKIMFDSFQEFYARVWREGAADALFNGLAATPGVDMGDMKFRQANLFTWETMVSTAAYQLSQDSTVPSAMVFEPPGRVGTRRTIPELNMTYGCQLPSDDPKNLSDIIYGFLRGAARLTGKEWGTSIYGAFDRSDAFWYLNHAYDLGATRFFFWDNAAIACVPYRECLALARNLRAHAENNPHRDLNQLTHAAEVAILLPPGYNLGHVQLGKGSLWGLGELNLERTNRTGVKYRQVMSNFFLEIERCLRFGTAFDLLWDLPELQPTGYREMVRIREDAKVEVTENGNVKLLEAARSPARPPGNAPGLTVILSASEGKSPMEITATAAAHETSAPIYYTSGADPRGVYHNAMVAWELYGPDDEDYRFLTPPGLKPNMVRNGPDAEITVKVRLTRPGQYRLRAATVDLAGRTTEVWKSIAVSD